MKHPSGIEPLPKVVHREVVIPEESTRVFPSDALPKSPVGRLAFAADLFNGVPLCDENGNPTGELSEPLISKADFVRIVESELPMPIDPWALGWQAWAKSKR